MATDNVKTLDEFITDVREHGDLEDITDRHSDAQLVRWINLAWRLLRTKVTNAGFSYFLQPTTAAALPTSAAVTGEQYLEVNYPAGAVGVYGLDVKVGGIWVPLKPGSFASRRDYQSRSGAVGGTPTHYIVRSVPTENTTTVSSGKIMIYPLATGGHDYIIWYLPVWADIDAANTTYVFYGHDIWFDWAIQDVVRRAAQKDDDSQNTLNEARVRQSELWDDIKRAIQNMQLAEPIVPRRVVRRGRRY